jgi:uncharacterized protein YprB with RNaseH-like and TPR domain
MGRIIFDIETTGQDFDALDMRVQEYLLRRAESEGEKEEVKKSLSLYPQTGEIIAIGMFNPDSEKGNVFFQCTSDPIKPFEEDGITYETGTEKEIIQKFWDTMKNYDQFITFNGRGFDCPFIIVRSAVHKIKPLRNLLPKRYDDTHIDLFDQLTFFGASRRRFSLDMWCRTFNIESPKESGISGKDVNDLYKKGKCLDIAKYCAGDLQATADLLAVWENYIKPKRSDT